MVQNKKKSVLLKCHFYQKNNISHIAINKLFNIFKFVNKDLCICAANKLNLIS